MTLFKNFHGYSVSEFGDVVGKHGPIKPFIDKDGYLRVSIRLTKGNQTKFHVHRLVYTVWIGNIPSDMVCCHIDSNIKNNHYSNLRVDTQKNNIRDKLKNGTWQAGDSHPQTIYSDHDIEKIQHTIKQNPDLKLRFLTSMLYPFPKHLVFDVKRGRRKTLQQRIQDAERLSI